MEAALQHQYEVSSSAGPIPKDEDLLRSLLEGPTAPRHRPHAVLGIYCMSDSEHAGLVQL
jgi:hypothetical protein